MVSLLRGKGSVGWGGVRGWKYKFGTSEDGENFERRKESNTYVQKRGRGVC